MIWAKTFKHFVSTARQSTTVAAKTFPCREHTYYGDKLGNYLATVQFVRALERITFFFIFCDKRQYFFSDFVWLVVFANLRVSRFAIKRAHAGVTRRRRRGQQRQRLLHSFRFFNFPEWVCVRSTGVSLGVPWKTHFCVAFMVVKVVQSGSGRHGLCA